jgi:hypothetical protein
LDLGWSFCRVGSITSDKAHASRGIANAWRAYQAAKATILADPNLRNDPEVHAKLKELKSVLTQSQDLERIRRFRRETVKGGLNTRKKLEARALRLQKPKGLV